MIFFTFLPLSATWRGPKA